MPPVSHSNSSQTVLGLPTVAPVLEYICLFTHDLKRKQKRWQDGRLKFHTFNKRIMVYDERGNFIGDMHWREDFDFGEGEEFNLERGAVIVQVAECIGSKDQDLTELLEKRAKDIEQRHNRSSLGANPLLATARQSIPQQHPQAQFRQRHLADVFNTPRGPQGRASIPIISPYQDRMAAQQSSSPQDENQRPAKKRKRDISPPSKSGYAQNLFGATLTLSTWSSNAPVRSQPTQAPRNVSPAPDAQPHPVLNRSADHSRRAYSTVVDLDLDDTISLAGNPKASDQKDVVRHAMGVPSSKITTVSRPFKTPGVGAGTIMTNQEDCYFRHSAEVSTTSSHRPDYHTSNNSRNVLARDSIQRSQDSVRKPVSGRPVARPNNDGLRGSTLNRASVDMKVSETHEALGKHVGNTAMQLATEAPMTLGSEDEVLEEPVTKLRIRTRQKRGLLMVANKATPNNPSRQEDGANKNSTPTEKRLPSDDASPRPFQPARSVSPVGDLPGHPLSGGNRETVTNYELPTEVANCNELKDVALVDLELSSNKDAQPSGEPLPHSKRPLRQKGHFMLEHRKDAEARNTNPGPRLASLGRKSVRSKEIIGSFNSRRAQISHETSTPAPALHEESLPPKRVAETDTTVCEKADNAKGIGTRRETLTRMANPATRGRKAAKKSDAAGSVPQSVVPNNPDLSVMVNSTGRGARRLETRANTGSIEGKTESVEHLPGFSRANGGPWSKEAYDLLGYTRPG